MAVANDPIKEFFEEIGGHTEIENDLHLWGRPIRFEGMGGGGSEDPQKDQLRILFRDESQCGNPPIGALCVTREQWEEMKTLGDNLLNGISASRLKPQ